MYNYLFSIFLSFFNVDVAMKLATVGDYDTSNVILNKTKLTKENSGQYLFLKAANAYALNKKQDALKWLDLLENSFEEIPVRYRNLGYLMEMEIKGWSLEDLGDIGRDMRISKDRLRTGKGGGKTQKVQQDIIAKLDKLIKNKEDQNNQAEQQAKQAAEDKAKANQSPTPAIEEIIASTQGKGTVDEKKLKVIAESWGTMPPKQRAKVIMDLTKDLPARYRVVIEDYFKALSQVPAPRP
jgi:hypothetical protein